MLSIRKKMYLCIKLDTEGNVIDDPNKMKIRGVTLARRDNCEFQRNFYKQSVWKVMHREPFMKTFDFIIEKCIELVSHSVKWEDLTMIKGLGSHYKNANYMMKIFSDEMEKAGNPMVAGDRIPYVVVKTGDETGDEKMGYKMRTIELYEERAKSENPEHIDYILYLEKTIANGIEKQLFQIGYKKELEELNIKHQIMDADRFFLALKNKISNTDINENMRNIRINGYNNKIAELFKAFKGNKIKMIEALLDDSSLNKIVKPLYNYHIKRRLGRGRRISSRIDKEPIRMIVRLFKVKEEVMKELRKYKPKKKKLVLKII